MTQTPPQMQGQIEAPNPLELFWEKNKKLVIGVAIALAAALAVNYGVQYMNRQARNADWTAMNVGAGLDAAYTRDGSMWSMIQSMLEQNPGFYRYYVAGARDELVSRLGDDIKKADPAALEAILSGGGDRAPLALWALAVHDYENEEWDSALARLDRLEKEFPKHFLVLESEYPVQFRPEVEKEEDESEDPKPTPVDEEPELEPQVAGSDVKRLRAAILGQREFEANNSRFYVAPEPTSTQQLVLEIENAGTIRIRLYDQVAPEHAKALLALAGTDFFVGQRVYEIRREAGGSTSDTPTAGEMLFGWPSTKENDREQWKAGDVEEDHLVDWEDTGLSHFPFMVAVEAAKEGRSQVERIVINSVDLAVSRDGNRVIVGRVVEGQDVVEQIVQSQFSDAAELERGTGRPEETYTITSVTVE